ncbi:MAG: hypothetical protein LQ348_003527, partial [Seirophora lacunosa]
MPRRSPGNKGVSSPTVPTRSSSCPWRKTPPSPHLPTHKHTPSKSACPAPETTNADH